MTVLAEKLAAAGYSTAQVGKWHCGLATPTHTPVGRGYQQSLTYLDGANDYWTTLTNDFCDPKAYRDLWEHDRPATEMANSLNCSQTNQAPGCIYEDDRIANFTLNIINSHDVATPLHAYIAWHNTHEPLEVPQAQLDKFDFIFKNCTAREGAGGGPHNSSCSAAFLAATEDGPLGLMSDKPCCYRQYYAAMTNYVDMHIGQVVDALKQKGMWENTVMLVSSDNGGPIVSVAPASLPVPAAALRSLSF
jgi:arylsulfatase A-like enzyme